MLAQVHIHPAGSAWQSGAPIDAESIVLGAQAGPTPPSLTFGAKLSQRPRPRQDQATLVIDGHPVETVFTPMQRGATMTGTADFGSTSNTCVGALAHLAELADVNGWPHADLDSFRAAAQAYIATKSGFSSATGITSASLDGLLIADTLGSSALSPLAGSVDKFADEIQPLLGAISRYTLENGLPLDWWMDTSRRLRAATPLRAAPNASIDLIAGRNADEITEGVDLSVGRVASNMIVGTKGSTVVTEVPGIASRFGDIDLVASSGSASAIATAMSAQLRTFGITVGADLARVDRGVPGLWVGDRVRVRDTDGKWARCAILSASLAVMDGGGSVTISATAAEGDW